MTPKRIQRKRTKGWRMPGNTISVTRPGKWGNPFSHKSGFLMTIEEYVHEYRTMAEYLSKNDRDWRNRLISELRGKNLACFCAIQTNGRYIQCHADVLLSLANGISMEDVRDENLRWAKREEV